MKLFIKRFLLVIIGIFLSLILLECGLRLAGWTISSYQQYKNNKTLRSKSQYTIMCLGESTTAGQYPVQLQQILNYKYPNKFSVIDCGIPATNLEMILDLLDNNINKYNPDITICMMGVNNNNNFTILEQNSNNYITKSKKTNLKIIKLFLLIKQHLNVKTKLLFAQEPQNKQELLELAMKQQHQNKIKESTSLFEKILEISEKDSNNYQCIYTYLIINYLCFLKDNRGIEMAINAIKRNYFDKDSYYFYLITYLIINNRINEVTEIILLLLNDINKNNYIPIIDIYNKIEPYLSESQKSLILNRILSKQNNYHVIAMQYLKQKDYQKAQ